MTHVIITPQEMYRAEQAVFDAGLPSFELMRLAGEGVAEIIQCRHPDGPITVLCGPGGNGGDGFVAAARLASLGRLVSVYLLGSASQLQGDTRTAAALWPGTVHALSETANSEAGLVIDALFGAGLSRPLEGVPAQLAEMDCETVVSIDVPSGLDGLTGRPLGACFHASLTVTFAALRPAHVLSPGKRLCGSVEVVDIGVSVSGATTFRPIEASERREALVVSDEVALAQLTGAMETAPVNRIEAVRMAARRQGRAVLLTQPDTILAKASGEVVVSSN